ncbi:MAG: protein kinase [Planctomycetes bacterium]|nr:protein kinase [Planctomycetota bacterium]
MARADILCTCGNRFAVQDDGNGAPHPCPRCQMLNVLPRTAGKSSAGGGGAAETAVRSTEVLSSVGQSVRSFAAGLPPGTLVGPYRVVKRVGRGGMGSVYEALDERAGTRVALKVLSPELAQREDFVARFHRESRVLARMSDPRIAKVFFNGAAEGLPFFAMEFIDGRNLEEILQDEGPLDPQQAVHFMAEAAVGLAAAVDHGLIHRDVKPTNLLIDGEGRLRIVDFGLAKTVDSESRLTVTGAVIGTPFYLSPEQGLGKPVDQRSDIYSLGATFYHLLGGRPPFDAESPVSIIMKHVNEPPEPLTERNARVPEPLARVVMRCIAKDPRRRYQDYDELIDDLEAIKAGEPVTAPTQETSIRRSAPSFVVVDDLDEGARVLRRASRPRRAFALALDFGVLYLAWEAAERTLERWLGVAPLLVMPPLAVLYFALGDGLGGGSVGKRFFRLRVARPNGSSPGLAGAILRALFSLPLAAALALAQGVSPESVQSLLSSLGLAARAAPASFETVRTACYALLAVDLLASLFTRRHAALHDLFSGTAVFREQQVKKRKKVRRKPPPKPAQAADSLKPDDLPAPAVPAVASAIVPGLGQLLNRQGSKGIVFFVGFALTLFLASGAPLAIGAVWVLGIWEAHRTAARRLSLARKGHLRPEDDSDI